MSTSYAPAGSEPHALVRSAAAPGTCSTCHHVPRIPGPDPVHSLPGTCDRCGSTTPPLRTTCDPCLAALRSEADDAWAERMRSYRPTKAAPGDDWDEAERPTKGARQPIDMSPEAVAARAEAKRRHGEAIEYVAGYAGTWGLPLDIRANPKWGTAYLRLSAKQVDALLSGKDRDEQRSAATVSDPRQARAREFIGSRLHLRPGFEADMAATALRGTPYSDRQLEAIERWQEREEAAIVATRPQAPGLAPQPPAGSPLAPAPVAEGMYRLDGVIYKVQRAVHGSGNLYAKRLRVDDDGGTFEFEPGAIRRLRADHRMTIDEAAEFGKLYGWCCVCGRQLTDEKSIAAGIGPVCKSRI